MNTQTDFPCSHPKAYPDGDFDPKINGRPGKCPHCHKRLFFPLNGGCVDWDIQFPVPLSPIKAHRPDFLLSDTPDGYRAGFSGEKVGPGTGWERLEDDGGGEAWMQLGETCDTYHLTESHMKHRIRISPTVKQAFDSHPEGKITMTKEEMDKCGVRIFQVGGDHYSRLKVQPFDLIDAMEPSGIAFVDYARGCIIKYASRKKGDAATMAQDLRKAAHYAEEAAKRLEGK